MSYMFKCSNLVTARKRNGLKDEWRGVGVQIRCRGRVGQVLLQQSLPPTLPGVFVSAGFIADLSVDLSFVGTWWLC